MNKKLLALGVLSAALALSPAHAQTPPATEKPAPVMTTSDTPLLFNVGGDVVTLNWTLPEGTVRKVEVCRHVLKRIEGRRRVATLTKDATTWSETLPDAKRTYWYWVKVTLADETIINIGPAGAKIAAN